ADICMEAPVRTTLDLNDALLIRAKAEAARRRTTLTRLIERGLGLVLEAPPEAEPPREPFVWRVTSGGTLQPGIDPSSNASLYAAADEDWAMRQAGLLPFRDPDGSPE
ncbi:MAG TPA: hypothetical protein VGD56_01770, partial [Gemmatirosa sp.]